MRINAVIIYYDIIINARFKNKYFIVKAYLKHFNNDVSEVLIVYK